MIVILKSSLDMTSQGCPSQWDAKTITGDNVYIRLRHGLFRLDVNDITEFWGNPDGFDGIMNTEEMIVYVTENSEITFH